MNNTLTCAALAAALSIPALAQQALNSPEDIANEQITVIALAVRTLGSEEAAATKATQLNALTERVLAVNAAKLRTNKEELETIEAQMMSDPTVQQVIALFVAVLQQQANDNFGGSLELQQAVMNFLQACSESQMGSTTES